MPSLRNWPVKSASRWRVPIGVATVAIDWSFVGIDDVADELGAERREVLDDPAEGRVELGLVGRK